MKRLIESLFLLVASVAAADAATNFVGPAQSYSCAAHTFANSLTQATGVTTCVQPAIADTVGLESEIAQLANLTNLGLANRTQTIFGPQPSLSAQAAGAIENARVLSGVFGNQSFGGTVDVQPLGLSVHGTIGSFSNAGYIGFGTALAGTAVASTAYVFLSNATDMLINAPASGGTIGFRFANAGAATMTSALFTVGVPTTINSPTFKVTTLAVGTAIDVPCYTTVTGLFTEEPTATTCTVSDERKKVGMKPISQQRSLDIIMKSKPISFYYRADLNDPDYHLGFGAQTLATIAPELVGRDDNGIPNAVKQLELLPITWAAIKQLQAENTTLRNEVDILKARLR